MASRYDNIPNLAPYMSAARQKSAPGRPVEEIASDAYKLVAEAQQHVMKLDAIAKQLESISRKHSLSVAFTPKATLESHACEEAAEKHSETLDALKQQLASSNVTPAYSCVIRSLVRDIVVSVITPLQESLDDTSEVRDLSTQLQTISTFFYHLFTPQIRSEAQTSYVQNLDAQRRDGQITREEYDSDAIVQCVRSERSSATAPSAPPAPTAPGVSYGYVQQPPQPIMSYGQHIQHIASNKVAPFPPPPTAAPVLLPQQQQQQQQIVIVQASQQQQHHHHRLHHSSSTVDHDVESAQMLFMIGLILICFMPGLGVILLLVNGCLYCSSKSKKAKSVARTSTIIGVVMIVIGFVLPLTFAVILGALYV